MGIHFTSLKMDQTKVICLFMDVGRGGNGIRKFTKDVINEKGLDLIQTISYTKTIYCQKNSTIQFKEERCY